MSKKPKRNKKPKLWESPHFKAATVKSLAARAAEGDAEAMRSLSWYLDRNPELRETVRDLDTLIEKSESAWVEVAGNGNPVATIAVQDEIAVMKKELLGANPTIVEKLLVNTIVTAHLSHQYAANEASRESTHPAQEALRNRRAESTQRRLLGAIRAWVMYQRAKASGRAPAVKLKVFQPQTA